MSDRIAVRAAYAVSLLLAINGAVAADETPTAGAEANSLQEVVVTAQKRVERLQDVPVSVSVVSGSAITEQEINSPHELAALVPNLQTAESAGGSNVIYSLRGISLTDVSPNQRGPIAIYYDESYRGASAIQGINLFDLERVEVLRGPQGTLYGMNATGGAINFVSKRPGYDLEGYLNAGYGNFNRVEAEGALQTPIVQDKLAVRVAFTYQKADGWFQNLLPGYADLNSTDQWAIRASVLWDATENVQFVLRMDTSKQDPTSFAGRIHVLDPTQVPSTCYGLGSGVGCGFFAPPYFPTGLGNWQLETNYVPHFTNSTDSVALTATWKLSQSLELTSVASWVYGTLNSPQNTDDSPIDVYRVLADESTVHQLAEDLRLASSFNGPVNFTLGMYYNHEQSEDNEKLTLFAVAGGDCNLLIGAACALINNFKQKKEDLAGYLDVSYKATDLITLHGGIRVSHDKGEVYQYNGGYFNLDGSNQYLFASDLPTCTSLGYTSAPCPGLFNASASYSDTLTTGRAGIDFHVAKGVLLYLSWSRGFRSAAFNNNALDDPVEIQPTKPETVDSVEVGAKTQWLDNSLTLNAAAFHYSYNNQQAANQVGALYVLYSIPNSRITGGELEAAWRPYPRLTITAGMGYTDGTIKSGVASGVDLAGKRLPLSSRFTGNLGIDWDVMQNDRGVIALGLNGNYSSLKYFDIQNTERLAQPSYGVVDAHVRWHDARDRFSVNLWGRNLFDRYYYTNNFDISIYGYDWGNVGPPRTYGVTLGYKF